MKYLISHLCCYLYCCVDFLAKKDSLYCVDKNKLDECVGVDRSYFKNISSNSCDCHFHKSEYEKHPFYKDIDACFTYKGFTYVTLFKEHKSIKEILRRFPELNIISYEEFKKLI